MLDLVVIGLGEVFRRYWGPLFIANNEANVVGLIDLELEKVLAAKKLLNRECWSATSVFELTNVVLDLDKVVCLVATYDHLPVIKQLAQIVLQTYLLKNRL